MRRQPNEVSDLDGSRRRLTEKIHSKINSSIVVSSVGRQRLQRFFPALQRDLIGGSDDTANTRCSVTKSQRSNLNALPLALRIPIQHTADHNICSNPMPP